MSSGSDEYRCKYCNAPLDVSLETIAIVCSYCGSFNWVKEEYKDVVLVVKPMRDKDVLENIRVFASKKGLGEIFRPSNISKNIVVLIPFYFVDVSAEAKYSGKVNVYVEKCVSSRNQRKCWTEVVGVHVNGVYGPVKDVIPVLGRRGVGGISAKALAYRYVVDKVEAVPLSSSELDKNTLKNILSIEVEKKTALDIAIDAHLDRLRKTVENIIKNEAERKVSGNVVNSRIVWKKITPVNVNAVSSQPTLLPMYVINYKNMGEIYRVIACGWNGNVIVLEKPMKKIDRILWGTTASLTSGFTGGLAAIISVLADVVFAGAAIILIGGIASWYCLKKALAPVKSRLMGVNLKDISRY